MNLTSNDTRAPAFMSNPKKNQSATYPLGFTLTPGNMINGVLLEFCGERVDAERKRHSRVVR